MLDVAQLVRAPDCGSGGRGFEPHRSTQLVIGVFYSAQITRIKRIKSLDIYYQINNFKTKKK